MPKITNYNKKRILWYFLSSAAISYSKTGRLVVGCVYSVYMGFKKVCSRTKTNDNIEIEAPVASATLETFNMQFHS